LPKTIRQRLIGHNWGPKGGAVVSHILMKSAAVKWTCRMKRRPADLRGDLGILPQLPARVTWGGSESPETVAYLSGAALGHLDIEP
jgi:hypothetical protein